ncbi:DUF6361 family protein [Crenobacter intestini]|uniref:Uncharacterized protein n=1 Tax=Crenobacter intestini TaxID=2563443 RepID=A0A4T0UP68_9NEIS|nr:DUF6361 family protein [Crenobacter intestini]TIC80331.1 hypothetical protein E5K04_12565 [Crenobacter intestini]
MAGSLVAWLSFDHDQQQRTQLLMAALSQQGTVDELGMGILRDLVAGVLFPGHTVLHTRAKYLLFLPRDFTGLKGSTAEALSKAARKAETDRIAALRRHYEPHLQGKGIIGYTTGSETKQMPSGSYWGLLRRLGIYKGKGSLWDAYSDLATERSARLRRSMFHAEDEDDQVTPEIGLWDELPEPDDEFDGFDLSTDEAAWLREKFLLSDKSPVNARSLVSWLLDPDREEWVEGLSRVWDHPQVDEFPAITAEAMWLGRDADRLVFGARILYNYLCAVGRPDDTVVRDQLVEKYEKAMKDWLTRRDELPSPDRLAELNAWATSRLDATHASQAARIRWGRTMAFLTQWLKDVSASQDLLADKKAETTITKREASLKPGRARLVQRDRLRNWKGDAGYFEMDYNWAPAQRLINDIHAGLRTPRVSWPPAPR